MMRTFWPFVLAAVVLASCGTSGGRPDANTTSVVSANGECQISRQSRDLNAILRRAAESGGDLNAVVAANAEQIRALAGEAGSGAATQGTPARKASCYSIALRAHGALLRSPAHEQAAFAAISEQAEAGSRACSAIPAPDAGARADCDLIGMWTQTIDGLEAARELQKISAGAAGATESAPVTEATWDRVNAEARKVLDNVNHWDEATPPQTPAMVNVVADHKTRVVCSAWAPLVSMRNLAGRGSPAWQRVYATTYPATMLAAANALSSSGAECRSSDASACAQSRVLELERRCNELSGR